MAEMEEDPYYTSLEAVIKGNINKKSLLLDTNSRSPVDFKHVKETMELVVFSDLY